MGQNRWEQALAQKIGFLMETYWGSGSKDPSIASGDGDNPILVEWRHYGKKFRVAVEEVTIDDTEAANTAE